MAMAFLRKRLANTGNAAEWRVESAGTWAREGMPAAQQAQIVMSERGIDLSNHRSRCVNRAMLHSFDLILVMSRDHQEALSVEFPGIADRVYLLSEMVGKSYDVPDPIDSSLADVNDVARDIKTLIYQGFERITKLAGGAEASGLPQHQSSIVSGDRKR